MPRWSKRLKQITTIDAIPDELLSNIFILMLPHSSYAYLRNKLDCNLVGDSSWVREILTQLIYVNKHWKAIVESTPRLWSCISLDSWDASRGKDVVAIFQTFMERSKQVPLQVNLGDMEEWERSVKLDQSQQRRLAAFRSTLFQNADRIDLLVLYKPQERVWPLGANWASLRSLKVWRGVEDPTLDDWPFVEYVQVDDDEWWTASPGSLGPFRGIRPTALREVRLDCVHWNDYAESLSQIESLDRLSITNCREGGRLTSQINVPHVIFDGSADLYYSLSHIYSAYVKHLYITIPHPEEHIEGLVFPSLLSLDIYVTEDREPQVSRRRWYEHHPHLFLSAPSLRALSYHGWLDAPLLDKFLRSLQPSTPPPPLGTPPLPELQFLRLAVIRDGPFGKAESPTVWIETHDEGGDEPEGEGNEENASLNHDDDVQGSDDEEAEWVDTSIIRYEEKRVKLANLLRAMMQERPQLHIEIKGKGLTDLSKAQFNHYRNLAKEFPGRFIVLDGNPEEEEVLIHRPETWS